MLQVSQYREAIYLNTEFTIHLTNSEFDKNSIVNSLLHEFIDKRLDSGFPKDYEEKRRLLQSLITAWNPSDHRLSKSFKTLLSQLLQEELNKKNITDSISIPYISNSLPNTSYAAQNHCKLWKGDITTLKIDSIVNAANNQMLGCFQPFHKCIDNAIHCAAGVELREDCFTIMKLQGKLEETGFSKITRAYNLPSKYVLHTVGPIVKNHLPTLLQKEQLVNCYLSCLNLAVENNIRSIAFCGISTGVFGYPDEEAAYIALKTVSDWTANHASALETIVFNVFSERDEEIYKKTIINWNEYNR